MGLGIYLLTALLVQMWIALPQSNPSRHPPFTETTLLFCSG